MNIYGLDFTSAPSRKKPITCAVCELTHNSLKLNECLKLSSFAEFEAFLRWDGPWLAALDFPFGQPRQLITSLGWHVLDKFGGPFDKLGVYNTWEGYVEIISSMGKKSFEDALLGYCANRPVGEKYAFRRTDVCAGARSPMMLHRVPVAKMFFQGATRLLASGVSILPCRPTNDSRKVVEGYPALVARRWIGKSSYKSDDRARQTVDKEVARQRILCGLRSPELLNSYGCKLEMTEVQADAFVRDATGDDLDALLCAVQAVWAYLQRDNGYGIPPDCDRVEGWIVDPAMMNKWHSSQQ
jgi:Protein of unknown function (DUF429)